MRYLRDLWLDLCAIWAKLCDDFERYGANDTEPEFW